MDDDVDDDSDDVENANAEVATLFPTQHKQVPLPLPYPPPQRCLSLADHRLSAEDETEEEAAALNRGASLQP